MKMTYVFSIALMRSLLPVIVGGMVWLDETSVGDWELEKMSYGLVYNGGNRRDVLFKVSVCEGYATYRIVVGTYPVWIGFSNVVVISGGQEREDVWTAGGNGVYYSRKEPVGLELMTQQAGATILIPDVSFVGTSGIIGKLIGYNGDTTGQIIVLSIFGSFQMMLFIYLEYRGIVV